ncbi:YesK family protein [Halobacillus sp. Marseille-Q1614]|uniref:YesK family protein n=1 Tax=Halobacillus sp. Marseille-Q1614 TaxID=2709134 RepID=UPI00156FDEAD|nr:YesK family protein [Halobacillus sp. Marseille-Q1614]
MEIELVFLSIVVSLILAVVLHLLQKKLKSKKHIGDVIFTQLIVLALVIFPISFFVGGWDGLFWGAVGVYMLIPSLSGLIFTKLIKRSGRRTEWNHG